MPADLSRTKDGQIPCITPRIDAEDAASLILFVDHFLPMLDITDPDSRDTANNIFRVRQKIHQTLGHLGSHIGDGVSPV